MNNFETLLANVRYPRIGMDVNSIESRIEKMPGVFECSLNPVSKNAMIVLDPSKTDITRVNSDIRKEGISISKILLRR